MTAEAHAPVSRRSLIRATGFWTLGVASAALFGCSRSETPRRDARVEGEQPPQPQPQPRAGGIVAPVVRGTRRRGGVFTQAIPGTFRQHDAHTALGINVWHMIGERALEIHPRTGEVLPNLVTSWEAADSSGTELVLKLRPDVRTHDRAPWNGREFNAADLAFNLARSAGLTAQAERIPASAFQRASLLANLVRADPVDAHTVRVRLSAPNSAFFNALTDSRMLLMPREAVDIGFADPMKLGGVGPFQVEEWTTDVRLRFRRFDRYFRQDEPHFDEFGAIVIADPTSQEAAFVSGQTQLLPVTSSVQFERMKGARSDALAYEWTDTSWQHLRPRMSHEAFRDVRVRRAMSLALNYAELGNGAYGSGWGYQAALSTAYPEAWDAGRVSTLPGYNASTKDADRAEATRLLSAAGFDGGDGLRLEIKFPATNEASRENATRIQAQVSALFPRSGVTLRSLPDTASFATQQAAGSFDSVAYVITAAPDAALELASQYRTGGSRNYGGFSNADFDGLIDRALSEINRDARRSLLDEIQRRFVTEWLPMFVLYAQPARYMLAANIGGYDETAGPWYGLGSASKGGRWFYVDH